MISSSDQDLIVAIGKVFNCFTQSAQRKNRKD